MRIPLYEPLLNSTSKQYVLDCLDTNWISSKGKYVSLFEESFSNYTNINYSCSVANGTVAIDLALQVLGVGKGDSVVVPSLGYIAAASSVNRSGAEVIFADVDSKLLQICPDSVERVIQSNTKAIIGIHNYGIPYPVGQIQAICNKFNLFHIEDCAEALGASISNTHVGNTGDIATFSFYGNKTITTGEGGMICSNSSVLIDRARHLKSHAVSPYKQYWHDDFGCNYRMTNIACAIGLSQLEIIEEVNQLKADLFDFYNNSQLASKCFHLSPPVGSAMKASNWMNTFITPTEDYASKLRIFFEESNVETRPLFYPIHLMPMFNSKYVKLPVTEQNFGCGFNLPSYPHLMRDQQKLRHLEELIQKCPSF